MASSPSPVNKETVVLERLKYIAEKKNYCEELIKRYNDTHKGHTVEGYCPPVWDETMCWKEAKAGELVLQRCPDYIDGFSLLEHASKECLENGSWYRKYDTHHTWTNFTLCIDTSGEIKDYIQAYLHILKNLTNTGHYISLISLLISFAILISIKKLRCPHNVLHMHVFASFIMRASMTLLKESLFDWGLLGTRDFNIIDVQANWKCKFFISIWNYFIMANYSWILMEGLYLHNLIFQALFTNSSSIFLYVVLGWGLPVVFIVPWAVSRALLENEYCWTMYYNQIIHLLIRGPLAASIVVNFIFFIRITIVLWRKLQLKPKKYSRWAKSTLVLIPTFGVHYIVLHGFQYSTNPIVELVWLFCDQFVSCFEGFLVALLYCFLNGDVRNELRKKWSTFSFRDLLEKWRLYGPDSVFSSYRYFGDRFRRPRESCYSNSCTVDTTVTQL